MTKNESESTNHKSNSVTLTRRVGNTNYKVQVHFSETGEESMEDKILRMIQRDALNQPTDCAIMNAPQMSRQSERSA